MQTAALLRAQHAAALRHERSMTQNLLLLRIRVARGCMNANLMADAGVRVKDLGVALAANALRALEDDRLLVACLLQAVRHVEASRPCRTRAL
jgi:hypothetical protein